MKAIIYAGIGLFSVATVYGVADYYSSKKNGTLDKLYVEEETAIAPAVKTKENAATVVPVTEVKSMIAESKEMVKEKADKKIRKSKKEIRMEDFSRARIPEEIMIAEVKEEAAKNPEEKVVEKAVEKEVIAEAEPVTGKKITLDMFSRAPLKKMARPAKKAALKN